MFSAMERPVIPKLRPAENSILRPSGVSESVRVIVPVPLNVHRVLAPPSLNSWAVMVSTPTEIGSCTSWPAADTVSTVPPVAIGVTLSLSPAGVMRTTDRS